MVRSPFFILIILISIFSCKEEPSDKTLSNQNSKLAYALRDKAIVYNANKKYDSAFYYFDKAKSLFELEKDNDNIGYCLYQMAEVQQTYGDYTGSEETITELLPYKIASYDAPAYNLLGIISKEHGNYNDAIDYYKLAMNSTQNPADKQSPLNNIATVYIQQKEYKKAIPILNEILKTRLLDIETFQKEK